MSINSVFDGLRDRRLEIIQDECERLYLEVDLLHRCIFNSLELLQ